MLILSMFRCRMEKYFYVYQENKKYKVDKGEYS